MNQKDMINLMKSQAKIRIWCCNVGQLGIHIYIH